MIRTALLTGLAALALTAPGASAALWSLPSKSRPCARIGFVHEDGSGWLRLTGYGYRVRCLIPNPAEESRVFRMRCVRIGGR